MNEKPLKMWAMQICQEVYSNEGPSGVYDLINSSNELKDEQLSLDLFTFKQCQPCDAETPRYKNSGCLICGQ